MRSHRALHEERSSTTSATALTQVPVQRHGEDPVPRASRSRRSPSRARPARRIRGTLFQDTSWFAAMVPANDPKYVVVAMVEQAGFGSDVAAPLVRRMIETMYGIESDGPVITPSGQD